MDVDAGVDPPLAPMDVKGRLDRLREAMPAEVLLVTSLTNIGYLTGFWGSAGLLVVLAGEAILVTDGRYATQAEEQLALAAVDVKLQVVPATRQGECVTGLVKAASPSRIGLEAAHVTWDQQRRIASDWFAGFDLVATTGLVESLRLIKDRGELARLARAALIADRALAAVRPMLDNGPSEVHFGMALDSEMRSLGASGPSFETIVASGPNSAKPHHRPSSRRIGAGEPVVLDFGARVDGYCSDMSRTVWRGELGDAQLRRAVRVVEASQAAGVAAVAAGVAAKDVDAACREVIDAAGWADRFVHGTGHGVGLDIHEAPSVGATSADTLATGQVVTIEPGVYLPGIGGVRIEDTVVVHGIGCETLTLTPKDS